MEGLYIPMLKLFDGQGDETLMSMIRTNTRLPVAPRATSTRCRLQRRRRPPPWSR